MTSPSFPQSSKHVRSLAWPWLPLGLLGTALLLGGALGPACTAGGSKLGEGGSGALGSGGGIDFDAGSGGTDPDPDSGCAIASNEATAVPVNLLIMFDKSTSMAGDKWFQTTAALQSFFADPASAGLRVGIRYFPDHETECTGSCCDGSCVVGPCAVPTVEPGPLTADERPTDTQEQALFDSFAVVTLTGETPLSVALEGGLQWAIGRLAQAPSEKAAVLLVTDGEPTACNTAGNYIAGLAEDAHLQHGVLTFAIGLEGSSEALMNMIAHAGGTSDGIFIGSANAQQELIDALNAIRESTVACEYVVPEEVNGQPLDPTKMNVYFTPSGGATLLIGQVSGAGACTVDHGGWYYDDPINPSRLTFCDSTCNGIRSDPEGKIEIVVGCPTIPA